MNNFTKQETINKFRKRYMSGSAKDYEIVVALAAMQKASLLTSEEFSEFLLAIFGRNMQTIERSVRLANRLMSDDMLEQIVSEVRRGK